MADTYRATPSHTLAATSILNRNAPSQGRAGPLLDLGWSGNADNDQESWVKNLHNEDLWVLLRRLDRVRCLCVQNNPSVPVLTHHEQEVFEIRQTDHVPFGELDMTISDELQCSPNKLRAEVERLYMGMVRLGIDASTGTMLTPYS